MKPGLAAMDGWGQSGRDADHSGKGPQHTHFPAKTAPSSNAAHPRVMILDHHPPTCTEARTRGWRGQAQTVVCLLLQWGTGSQGTLGLPKPSSSSHSMKAPLDAGTAERHRGLLTLQAWASSMAAL